MSRLLLVCIALLCIIVYTGPAAAEMTVSIADSHGGPGSSVDIPVSVENADNLGSMDIVISYDPSVLSVISVEKGSLNKGMISADTTTPGIVSIGIVDAGGINGNGPVAVLKVKVTGEKGASGPLRIDRLLANNVKTHIDIQAGTHDGTFSVQSGGLGVPLPAYLACASIIIAVVVAVRKKIKKTGAR